MMRLFQSREPSATASSLATLFATLALAGCAGDEPRFGELRVSSDSPTATLSGVTHPTTPALEIAPGCAGFIDPDTPDHVIDVVDQGKVGVSARSESGPLTLLIVGDDGPACDSDENTGHVPHVQLTRPGRYLVHVGSLSAAAVFPYSLVVAPDAKDAHGAGATVSSISVTVTSEPAGANVRTVEGVVLGTTPAMFVLPLRGPAEATAMQTFVVELDGYEPSTVGGVPQDGELVLHTALTASGPRLVTLTATEAQPIRDFSNAEQTVTLNEACTVQDIEADVELQHSYLGDLIITLHAPTGADAVIHRQGGGARANLSRTYRMSDTRALRSLSGIEGRGEWKLQVRDTAELDVGSMTSFTLRVTCAPPGTQVSPPPQPATVRTRRSTNGRPNIRRRPLRRPRGPGVLDPWARTPSF